MSAIEIMIKTILSSAVTLVVLLSAPAVAGESFPDRVNLSKLEQPVAGGRDRSIVAMAGEDRQLELQKSDFLKFAVGRIHEMNQNHILSRERMRIDRRPDGLYRALFHEIDDASLSCQVSRSQTGNIPYVAVLSYREMIYTTSCATPEACRQGQFQPVEVIPNRHIFVYNNGAWQ